MFSASYDKRDRALFGIIYGSLSESAKNYLRTYIDACGMSSGSSAWIELEKRYFPQTDAGRQAALTALNNTKLTVDNDPQEYYQDLRLNASAYDAMRTDGGKHCEDDFKRIVMANLPDQYKLIGNTIKHTGATIAGIIAAIRDVWADNKSSITSTTHERTAGIPGAMTAMAAHAESGVSPMTRKCTFEYCTRPNSSHTTEQCWDRKAIEEQFQAAKQQRQQYAPSHDYNAPQQQHRVQQQQYSSYGA
jgi:hypothetical protein